MKKKTLKMPSKKDSIYNIIKSEILQGKYKAEEKIPSENELSDMYEVSRPPIREALSILIHENLICKIQGKGTFVAKTIGESESFSRRTKLTKRLGYVLYQVRGPISADPFHISIFEGADKMVKKAGYSLLFSTINSKLKSRNDFPQMINDIDGLILGGKVREKDTKFLRIIKDMPVIFVGNYIRHKKANFVVCNNREGAYKAVKYLIDCGYRKIGFIGGSLDISCFRERYQAYQEVLKENNLPYDKFVYLTREYLPKDGYKGMQFLFKNYLPEAVFAGNDLLAMG